MKPAIALALVLVLAGCVVAPRSDAPPDGRSLSHDRYEQRDRNGHDRRNDGDHSGGTRGYE